MALSVMVHQYKNVHDLKILNFASPTPYIKPSQEVKNWSFRIFTYIMFADILVVSESLEFL